jgi:hypothetical protein
MRHQTAFARSGAAGLFIVGLKRMERARGSGWLDCPNCHEHALQDVVDAMRFASVGFFRLTPVERKRFLICRRCGFRREASDAEIENLETMGRPLHRAWFVPFGGLSLVILAALVYYGFAAPSGGANVLGITFTNLNVSALLPATLDIPQNWNASFFTKPDDQPPPRLEVTTTSTGLEKIVLAKFTDSATLSDAILNHFADQESLETAGFPSNPPAANCTQMGKLPAAYVKIGYAIAGDKAEAIMYAFIKNGLAYTLTFVASGADNITLMEGIAKHAASSFKFLAAASASSSAGASATPSPSPSPSPAPAPAPGVSPSPAYVVSCH